MIRGLRRTWNRLIGSLLHRGADGDLAEELESHIDLMTDEYIRRGQAPDEARRRAKVQFGSVASTKESYRDQRGLPVIDAIVQDLRYAVRGIRNSPGFATVAILSLGIGIGANTAIFSIVNGVLLRPLAYAEPERVFVARELVPDLSSQPIGVNPMHPLSWREQCQSLEQVAIIRAGSAQLTGAGEPASLRSVAVSHDIFALLGVRPILGRPFHADEERDGAGDVVVISESLWRTRFAADPALVGGSIALDGRMHHVVGIAPDSLRLPFTASNTRFDVLRPLILPYAERTRPMGNYNYSALVRVRRGVSAEQALAEINLVQARFPAMAGSTRELKAVLTPAHEFVTSRARPGLLMLAAAVAAVLLIVCINLANLLLSRIASRGREAAIRTALGASRGRQFAQVLTESLLLSISGGFLGILCAAWIVRIVVATTTLGIPRLEEAGIDTSVLGFACLVAVLTGVLFGVLPAWRFTRHDPQEALRAGSHTVTEGRGGLRVREALISLEVSLSAALLIVAALLASSLLRLLDVDKGFDMEHVLTVDIGLAGSRYAEDVTREQLFDRLTEKVVSIPGVEASGFITQLPIRGQSWNDPIYLQGGTRHIVDNRYASPGYFRVMNIPITRGRAFDESDRDRGVAVLSEKAANILWPGDRNPIGRTFMGEDDKLKTLVGIVAEVRATLPSDPPPTAYYPHWQRVPDGMSLVVRTAGDPRAVAVALRAAIRGEDAQLPIPAIRTMADVVDLSVAQRRFQLTLMAVFAGCALLVASLGIYGVVSYSVARRRNEIGIRMALGAERSRLLAMIIRQGMAPVVVGLAAGAIVALLLGRAIRGLLFAVQPADPLIFAGVMLVLLVVGALACFIPARRAAGTDAVAALRFE